MRTSRISALILAVVMAAAAVASGNLPGQRAEKDARPPLPPCSLPCPTCGVAENEPGLVPNYVDQYNGGCEAPPNYQFQHIYGWCPPHTRTVFCGVSGWYSTGHRDSDWFTFCVNTGNLEITMDAEELTYGLEVDLGSPTCSNVAIRQQMTAGPCLEAYMTIVSPPGSTKYFRVEPTTFLPPPGNPPEYEYNYVIWVDGLCCEVPGCPVGTERTTWSTLKAVYD